eukprot:1685246-Rhodomonas_salina.1
MSCSVEVRLSQDAEVNAPTGSDVIIPTPVLPTKPGRATDATSFGRNGTDVYRLMKSEVGMPEIAWSNERDLGPRKTPTG